jgi:hypothetical protein
VELVASKQAQARLRSAQSAITRPATLAGSCGLSGMAFASAPASCCFRYRLSQPSCHVRTAGCTKFPANLGQQLPPLQQHHRKRASSLLWEVLVQ